MIKLKQSKIHRHGVFATKKIRKGQLVERCPFIYVKGSETLGEADDYVFGYNKNLSMLVLGYGSLYNHADEPNIKLVWNYKNKTVDLIATKTIQPKEECFITYGSEYWKSRNKKPM